MDRERKIKLQEIIRQNNLAALIFWRPDELVMTLGYMPLWGLSFLVYTADDKPVLYVPELEPEDILPEDVTIETYPWGVLDSSDPWKILYGKIQLQIVRGHLQHKAVSFIKSVGGTSPCRMSGEQPPLPADLKDRLEMVSSGQYSDISSNLLELYACKTPGDVEGIRRAHRVAKEAVKAFYHSMKPGITEAEVANSIEGAIQQMIGRDGIQFAKGWPMVQSGLNACVGGRYNRTSGKKLAESELVMAEMAICVDGYWVDITRTAAVGSISKEKEKLFHIVLEAQQKALSIMRPGMAMENVDAAAREYIMQAGWGHLFNHGLGHHVGFRYHDPGSTLSPASPGVLKEGMVLTVEPGIYGREIGAGIRIEDNVLITANGYELLSDYSKGLTGK